MANDLTNQIGIYYLALQVVSRELTGMISAVSLNTEANTAGLGQTINTFIVPKRTTSAIIPSNVSPQAADTTYLDSTLTLDTYEGTQFYMTAEEMHSLRTNKGSSIDGIFQREMEQSFRILTNTIESALTSLYTGATRAVTPTGTTLFDAANFQDLANIRKVLDDNGTGAADRHVILNTLAGSKIRGNATYVSANTAGTDSFQRQGTFLDTLGFSLKESNGIVSHTAGDGTDILTDATGYALESTVINTTSVLSGTVVAGDVVTFAGDPDTNYNVIASTQTASTTGTITLASPGLRTAIAASAESVDVDSTSLDRNMVFHRDAILLAVRPPIAGDSAISESIVTDPFSGLSFTVSEYYQYKQTMFEVSVIYGKSVINAEHLALLLD